MNDILKADFSNAKKGDKVKCLDGVDGIIDSINKRSREFAVECSNGDIITRINENGITEHGLYPVWFYDFDTQFPTIEACTRPLPTIEKDERVLICDSGTGKWSKRYATGLFVQHEIISIQCYKDGRDSFTSNIEFDYSTYWKLVSDPKINSGNLHEIEGENE